MLCSKRFISLVILKYKVNYFENNKYVIFVVRYFCVWYRILFKKKRTTTIKCCGEIFNTYWNAAAAQIFQDPVFSSE